MPLSRAPARRATHVRPPRGVLAASASGPPSTPATHPEVTHVEAALRPSTLEPALGPRCIVRRYDCTRSHGG
jgi:hypothetical protein